MKKMFVSIALASFPLQLTAQVDAPENEPQKKSQTNMADSSSRGNREGKMFDIAVGTGFSVFPVPSTGFSLGYYLTPDMPLELEYTAGKLNMLDESETKTVNSVKIETQTKIDVETSTIGLQLKKFWGNSFYTNSGLNQRKITFTGVTDFTDASGKLVNDNFKLSASATSITLNLAVGNKWQFSNFNIGCDWFGALIPLSSSSEANLPEIAGSKEKKDIEDIMKTLGDATTYQLLKLYIGASF